MPDLRIQDFSGGETDKFRDGPSNMYYQARNMYVNTQKRLESRPGYTGFSSTDVQPWGTQAVTQIWHHFSGFGSQDTEYQTFITSNGAVKRTAQDSGAWVDVDDVSGDSLVVPSMKQRYQWNYVRLSDNEFVLVTGAFSHPVKFYRIGATVAWTAAALGLPQSSGTTGYASPTFGGGNTYTWAIVLKHEYSLFEPGIGSLTKIVRGAPLLSDRYTSVTEPSSPGTETVISLGDIFGLAPLTDNQFLNNIPSRQLFHPDTVWEVYRTVNDGSILYKVGEIAADGTNFEDQSTDAVIQANEVLYTTGGVLPSDMPNSRPQFGTFANDCLWLASESRVWQSKSGIPDASPGSFNFDVREGEKITALNTMDVYPIIFTNLGVYRIEGIVDDLGNGTHRVRTISGAETKGALSNKTTVKTDNSIVYWSVDGIYETNGYTARKISNHYDDRYCEIVDIVADEDGPIKGYNLAQGCWDRKNQRVHWFYPRTGETNLTQTLTIDMKYQNESGYCITSGDVPYQVRAVGAADRNIHIANNDGQVLKQDSTRLLDLPLDIGTTNIGRRGLSIEWDYISCSMSFGSALIRKWFQRILFHFTNLSNLTVSILSDTDESNDFRTHNPIISRGVTRGLYFLKRGFPKGVLRGAYKQIRITNSIPLTIYKSDDLGPVTVSGTTFVTLNAGTWPADVHGGGDYALYFDYDGYTAAHPITSIGSDSSPFIPTGGLVIGLTPATNGTHEWIMKAVPNDEKVELNGYTVVFTGSGEGHAQSSVEGGGNV